MWEWHHYSDLPEGWEYILFVLKNYNMQAYQAWALTHGGRYDDVLDAAYGVCE